MSRARTLHIPQPCPESWAAMTPIATGRHCAACQQTVVDFTLKTDAEILAYLARAASGRTCGRFAAGQLGRPLQRAAPAVPSARWRAWLAAAVAVWGVREGVGNEASAQAPTEWRARYWGGPAPDAPVVEAGETKGTTTTEVVTPPPHRVVMGGISMVNPIPEHLASWVAPAPVLRGIVTDGSSDEGLPGATILVKGTQVGISTTIDGTFELAVPAALISNGQVTVVVQYLGYATQEHSILIGNSAVAQNFRLHAQAMGQLSLRPLPWHPREFYYWGKYWLTRPFCRR